MNVYFLAENISFEFRDFKKTPTTQTKTWNCTFVKNTTIIQRVVAPYIM